VPKSTAHVAKIWQNIYYSRPKCR